MKFTVIVLAASFATVFYGVANAGPVEQQTIAKQQCQHGSYIDSKGKRQCRKKPRPDWKPWGTDSEGGTNGDSGGGSHSG